MANFIERSQKILEFLSRDLLKFYKVQPITDPYSEFWSPSDEILQHLCGAQGKIRHCCLLTSPKNFSSSSLMSHQNFQFSSFLQNLTYIRRPINN